jgi:dihydrofolate synthase/folylpolyglutamate synthase
MHQADLRHPRPSLQKKLLALYQLRTGSKVNWDATAYRTLLRDMGEPHKKLPPVIHVAGTNGKGSIVAFLRAMLEAQGYRVHAYTSPHLLRVNERIRLAGEDITDNLLERMIDEVYAQHSLAGLSFFEITTALAFRAFSAVPADVLLLEVGMGGRLDCTNVIEDPLVSVISRISYDHTEFLGGTLADIAAEKGGILKAGRPCVVGAQGPEDDTRGVLGVLETLADERSTPLLVYGRDWRSFESGGQMVFEARGERNVYPLPGLAGAHQILNAGAALMALRVVGDALPVSEEAKAQGLRRVVWPGRMQGLSRCLWGCPKIAKCGWIAVIMTVRARFWRSRFENGPPMIRSRCIWFWGCWGIRMYAGFWRPLPTKSRVSHWSGLPGRKIS